MFVEEGFRIRFANGEVIDFYADTAAEKNEWMAVLSETIGKDVASGKAWTAMILDKEKREKAAAPQAVTTQALKANVQNMVQQSRPRSHEGVGSKSMPSSPVKGHSRTQSHAPLLNGPPPPLEKDQRHMPGAVPRKNVGQAGHGQGPAQTGRRGEVRSMIF